MCNCKENRNNCKNDCAKIKVGFIDELGNRLQPTIPYILKALPRFKNIVDVKFSFVPPFNTATPATIAAQADAVEKAIFDLYSQGFNYILFGLKSTYMTPWTNGDSTLTNFGGLNEQQRFPDMQIFFGYNNLGATATYEANNLTNCFATTDQDPNIPGKAAATQAYVSTGGSVVFIWQQGDAVSITRRDQYKAAAALIGVPFADFPIIYDPTVTVAHPNGTFTTAAAQWNAAIAAINALAGHTFNSVVMFAVNGTPNPEDALTNDLNNTVFVGTLNVTTVPPPTTGQVSFFGANYAPRTVTSKYYIQFFGSNTAANYSPYLVSLGFSNAPTFSTNAQSLYIESLGYLDAMACGKNYRGTDGTFKFDVNKALVFPFISQQYFPAGTFATVTASVIVNPRWVETEDNTMAFTV